MAEHLPEEAAETLVATLVRLGPAILFSAAIPNQGGENHLNEQWPSYWAARFESHGYRPIDCLRPRLWANEEVGWWYAQNMLLFAQRAYAEADPSLKRQRATYGGTPLSLIHPDRFLDQVSWSQQLMNERDALQAQLTALEGPPCAGAGGNTSFSYAVDPGAQPPPWRSRPRV